MAISLIEAIRNGDQDTAKRILQQRTYTCIDKQSPRKDGTALFWACCRGYIEIVHLLILHGADVNECTSWGAAPLHACADHNRVDILRLLFRFGANVNLQTVQGDTPCHLASYRGHNQCVQYLAEHGADINITNNKQHTVLDDALNSGHYGIYEYLLAVQDIVKKSDAKVPHPRRNSYKKEIQPTASEDHYSPTYPPIKCSNHSKENTLDKDRYHSRKENLVGVLRIQNSSLLNDSLLSSDSLSSLCCSNDLSRQNSVYSEPQLSYRNIP